MRSSCRSLVFLVFLGLGGYSAFAEDQLNDVGNDADDLLAAFSDAKRLENPTNVVGDTYSDEDDKRDLEALCLKHVSRENGLEKEINDTIIAECIAECVVDAIAGFDAKPILSLDDDSAMRCKLPADFEELETEIVAPNKRWKVFKKVGSWFVKNRKSIKKGLKIGAKIIGIAAIAVGKK